MLLLRPRLPVSVFPRWVSLISVSFSCYSYTVILLYVSPLPMRPKDHPLFVSFLEPFIVISEHLLRNRPAGHSRDPPTPTSRRLNCRCWSILLLLLSLFLTLLKNCKFFRKRLSAFFQYRFALAPENL